MLNETDAGKEIAELKEQINELKEQLIKEKKKVKKLENANYSDNEQKGGNISNRLNHHKLNVTIIKDELYVAKGILLYREAFREPILESAIPESFYDKFL